MKIVDCVHVGSLNGSNRLIENLLVVRVRQKIPVVKHIDPHLPVGDDTGGERFLYDIA